MTATSCYLLRDVPVVTEVVLFNCARWHFNFIFFFLVFSLLSSSRRLHRLSANLTARAFIRVVMLTVFVMKLANCSDRILTCRIKSIRSPAKVGLVVTDLITSPVVSWEGWETPPPPPAPRLCCHSLLNHRRGKTSLLLW